MSPVSGAPIFFYDGDCGVCTRSVRFILRHDRRRKSVRFASLQGSLAADLLRAHPELQGADSMFWYEPGIEEGPGLSEGPGAEWGPASEKGPGSEKGAGPEKRPGSEKGPGYEPRPARVQARSGAVIAAGLYLGGIWGVLARLGRLIPRSLRDGGYDLFARHRRRIPGLRTACHLPTPQESARFIDSNVAPASEVGP